MIVIRPREQQPPRPHCSGCGQVLPADLLSTKAIEEMKVARECMERSTAIRRRTLPYERLTDTLASTPAPEKGG